MGRHISTATARVFGSDPRYRLSTYIARACSLYVGVMEFLGEVACRMTPQNGIGKSGSLEKQPLGEYAVDTKMGWA